MTKASLTVGKAQRIALIAYNYVWEWRAHVQEEYGTFPTPDLLDSLRFAVCEAAEALDAYIRQDDTYSRNNGDKDSITDELGDTLFMLLTALGAQYEHSGILKVEPNPVDIDMLIVSVGDAHKSYAFFGEAEIEAKHQIEDAIFCCLSLMIDMYQCDPLDVLASRLMRIETRLSEEANHGK